VSSGREILDSHPCSKAIGQGALERGGVSTHRNDSSAKGGDGKVGRFRGRDANKAMGRRERGGKCPGSGGACQSKANHEHVHERRFRHFSVR
jgi:hypothetical protein